MKRILYMAMTPNGYIAKNDGSIFWCNDEWEKYKEKVNEIGNLVIGRKTYDIMKDDEFEGLENNKIIILSRKEIKSEKENFIFVKTPEEAIIFLEKNNFKKMLVAGGAEINSLFMKKNLIDEIILDLEPKLWGSGINLFNKESFDFDLELISAKKYGKNSVELRYKII